MTLLNKLLSQYKDASMAPEDDGRRADRCAAAELSTFVSYGMCLYKMLREREPKSFEESKQLYESLIGWWESTRSALRRIEEIEMKGIRVNGWNELECAVHELTGSLSEMRNRVRIIDDHLAGKCVPISELINAV